MNELINARKRLISSLKEWYDLYHNAMVVCITDEWVDDLGEIHREEDSKRHTEEMEKNRTEYQKALRQLVAFDKENPGIKEEMRRLMIAPAEWMTDVDFGDDVFRAPGCPICEIPIYREDGAKDVGKCYRCGKEYTLSSDMVEWFEERSGIKVETEICIGCGEVAMDVYYHKDILDPTKWKCGHALCKKCGMRLIV